jgi:CRP-like cAMP-binding protein
MSEEVVVLAAWPLADTVRAGEAIASVLGGLAADHAGQLARNRGMASGPLHSAQAGQLVQALASVDVAAGKVATSALPTLPAAETAWRLNPSREDALVFQIGTEGKLERVPWAQVIAVVPCYWLEDRRVSDKRPAKKKPSAAKSAMGIATGGIALQMLKAPKLEGGMTTQTDARLGLEVVLSRPLRRVRAYADRLDYSVLGEVAPKREANWLRLLGVLGPRLHPRAVGRDLLAALLNGTEPPTWLAVKSDGELKRTLVWLFARSRIAAARRGGKTTGAEAAVRRSGGQPPAPAAAGKRRLQTTAQTNPARRQPSDALERDKLWQSYGRVFPRGTALFERGDTSREMYVIVEGSVRISVWKDGEERTVAMLTAGEFFGEMAVLNGEPRSASAHVEQDAKIMVFDPQSFAALIRHNSDVAVRMVRKLAERLGAANARIEALLVVDPLVRVLTYIVERARKDGFERKGGLSVPITDNGIVTHVGLPLDTVRGVVEQLERARAVRRLDSGLFTLPVEQLERMLQARREAIEDR